MSFTYGIGDVIAVSKLAHDIWVRIHDSSDEYKAIRNEFRGFYVVLDDLAERLPGMRLDEDKTARLEPLVQGCKEVLDDTNAVVEEFTRLGITTSSLESMTQKILKKLTWNEDSIDDLRGRIISSTMLLNAFLGGIARFVVSPSNDKQIQRLIDSSDIVHDLKLHNDGQERRQILDKISTLNFATQKNAILEQRQEGTGQWFLDSRDFQEWMEKTRGTLFCTGMPGAGKTMLASIAIEHLVKNFLEQQDVGIAYIYCDYMAEANQTPRRLLDSLVKQLLEQSCSIPDRIRDLYGSRRDRIKTQFSSLEDVSESLRSIAVTFEQVYIVVDALDELSQDGSVVQDFLSSLTALQDRSFVNLLLTSRDIPSIKRHVKSDMIVEMRASNEDVMKYVEGRIGKSRKLFARKKDLEQTVKDAIVSSVDGMFLLARLHLESLADKLNPVDVREALESLPKGSQALSVAYHQTMQRIKAQKEGYKDLALKALGWITYAKRLLSVEELRYALAIKPGASKFDRDNLCDIDEINSACGGLVVKEQGQLANQGRAIVRLVHSSTQQFLTQNDAKYLLDAQRDIAVSCLNYLLQITIPPKWLKGRISTLLNLRPLLSYATQHWAAHASECLDKSVIDLTLQFLRDDYRLSLAAKVLWSPYGYIRSSDAEIWKIHDNYHTPATNTVSGIHLAVTYGFENIVSMLLDNGFGADAKDAFGRTPLCWAAVLGHTAIVKLLFSLNKNTAHWKKRDDGDEAATGSLLNRRAVDVNLQDSIGTPLSWAADRGHFDVVVTLLEQEDINPNLGTTTGGSPLACAASHGQEAVVRLLAAHADVDVNHGAFVEQTALIMAVQYRHKTVIKFLLSHPNINVNAGDGRAKKPLMNAVMRGYAYEAELLLTHTSVDVNYEDDNDVPALVMAICLGYETIVKLLLTCPGIDVNTKNRKGPTPLSIELSPYRSQNLSFSKAIVELLLARDDVDLRCIDEEGNDLLSRATKLANEQSIPGLENLIALLREAIEKRSTVSSED